MLDLGRREFAKPLVCLGQLDAGFHNLWLATNYFSVSIAQLPIDFLSVRNNHMYVHPTCTVQESESNEVDIYAQQSEFRSMRVRVQLFFI
jgi:hypothetical protein